MCAFAFFTIECTHACLPYYGVCAQQYLHTNTDTRWTFILIPLLIHDWLSDQYRYGYWYRYRVSSHVIYHIHGISMKVLPRAHSIAWQASACAVHSMVKKANAHIKWWKHVSKSRDEFEQVIDKKIMKIASHYPWTLLFQISMSYL